MAIRLEPQDEYMHALGDEQNFNESMYFNVYDPSQRIGGFMRLGNRANEGHAEMTVCLYLPDGRVAFMFGRPDIADNSAFDSGGMRFEVIRPFEELAASYQGSVVLLDDPCAMADPKAAFTDNPHADCSVRLSFRGLSPMFGGEPDEPAETTGDEFARGHYEQLVAGEGTITVGDQTWELSGYGLRDHSWGPRYWQAPWYYRWLTGNFGPGFGFMASRVARKEGAGTKGGFVWDGTALHLCHDVQITTSWLGDDSYHDSIDARLRSGDREWHIQGKVLSLIPLRNRRDGMVTRISEGMTRWTTDGDRVGYGLSEYLDQIVDGQPVGIGE
ncbi:MAG TPA: hypothetical protein VFH45_08720 [Acidimicrobiales bacterium]|nr:hypothetical protein [Acidimicrobiales bacterium]